MEKDFSTYFNSGKINGRVYITENYNHMLDIFQQSHGILDVNSLVPYEAIPNVYLTKEPLNPYIYWDGWVYTDMASLLMKDPELIALQLARTEKFSGDLYHYRNTNQWPIVFDLIDKRVGIPVFIREYSNIPKDQIWDCFVKIYTRSEFGFDLLEKYYTDIFYYAKFSKARNERLQAFFLDRKESYLKILHGENISYPVYDRYSWTLDITVAEFFATRYKSELGEIWETEIKMDQVVDYLNSKGEKEILYCYTGREHKIVTPISFTETMMREGAQNELTESNDS